MYKVGIIEDTKVDYRAISKQIERYDFIAHDQSVDIVTQGDSIKSYCKNIISSEASIFIVDWELKLENKERAKSIFECMRESYKLFNLYDKYWIFCSASKEFAYEQNNFVEKFFPRGTGCYRFAGKQNLKDPSSTRDIFLECIEDAIQYLQKTEAPFTLKELVEHEPRKILKLRHFGGSFFDLELNRNDCEKVSLELPEERFICMAFLSKTAFIFFITEDAIIKVWQVKLDHSMKGITKRLESMEKTMGFIYNPLFFDEGIQILDEIKPYINNRAQVLYNKERYETLKAWERLNQDYYDSIDTIFRRLIDHGILKKNLSIRQGSKE